MGLWSRDGECPMLAWLATKVNPKYHRHCQWRATGPSGREIAGIEAAGACTGHQSGRRDSNSDFLLARRCSTTVSLPHIHRQGGERLNHGVIHVIPSHAVCQFRHFPRWVRPIAPWPVGVKSRFFQMGPRGEHGSRGAPCSREVLTHRRQPLRRRPHLQMCNGEGHARGSLVVGSDAAARQSSLTRMH